MKEHRPSPMDESSNAISPSQPPGRWRMNGHRVTTTCYPPDNVINIDCVCSVCVCPTPTAKRTRSPSKCMFNAIFDNSLQTKSTQHNPHYVFACQTKYQYYFAICTVWLTHKKDQWLPFFFKFNFCALHFYAFSVTKTHK